MRLMLLTLCHLARQMFFFFCLFKGHYVFDSELILVLVLLTQDIRVRCKLGKLRILEKLKM